MYRSGNKVKELQTSDPAKYPQGKFNPKQCRHCSTTFQPNAPSELYCSDECKDWAWNDKYMKRTYGISYNKYLEMVKESNGKCAICGGDGFILNPNSKMKMVVDHCHESGEVRGLLCHNCNRGLGLFQDDVSSLKNAISYLERATTIREE